MAAFKKKRNNIQTGAALLEFAIVLPLLLLLLAGIIEFSFAFYHLNILNKSVEDGARYFSDPVHASNDQVGNLINVTNASAYVVNTKNLVKYGRTDTSGTPPPLLMPTLANYTIHVSCAEQDTNLNTASPTYAENQLCQPNTAHIRVTAVYNHNFLLGDLLNSITGIVSNNPDDLVPNPFPLTASTAMRVQ
jgi:hypothetical protein